MPKRKAQNNIDESKEKQQKKSHTTNNLLKQALFYPELNQLIFDSLDTKGTTKLRQVNKNLEVGITGEVKILNVTFEELKHIFEGGRIFSKVHTIQILSQSNRSNSFFTLEFSAIQFSALKTLIIKAQVKIFGELKVGSHKFVSLICYSYTSEINQIKVSSQLQKLWIPTCSFTLERLHELLQNYPHLTKLAVAIKIPKQQDVLDLRNQNIIALNLSAASYNSLIKIGVRLSSLQNMEVLQLRQIQCSVENTDIETSSIRWLELNRVGDLNFLRGVDFPEINFFEIYEEDAKSIIAQNIYNQAMKRNPDEIDLFESVDPYLRLGSSTSLVYCHSLSGLKKLELNPQENGIMFIYNIPQLKRLTITSTTTENIYIMPCVKHLEYFNFFSYKYRSEELVVNQLIEILNKLKSIRKLYCSIPNIEFFNQKIFPALQNLEVDEMKAYVTDEDKSPKKAFRLSQIPHLKNITFSFSNATKEVHLELDDLQNLRTVEMQKYYKGKVVVKNRNTPSLRSVDGIEKIEE